MHISIIIASGAGGEYLFKCLDSLERQAVNAQVEVIVVDRYGGERVDQISHRYPFVNVIPAETEHTPSVPELRLIGVQHAVGDIAAIIEEHCLAPPDWVESIRSSFKESDAAIGGPILDDNYARLTDWAVYFSEYHNYLPPWKNGAHYNLNGANIAYNRDKLIGHADDLSSGFWEVVLHPSLYQEGDFRSVPEMGVRHMGQFGYSYYLRQRYLLSRVWGGTRREQVSASRRALYLIMVPILPFFILYRISRKILPHSRLKKTYIKALPRLVPIVLAYVIGEWTGYLAGVGDALEYVE